MHHTTRIYRVFSITLLLLLGCSDRSQDPLGIDDVLPDWIADASISYADSTDDVYLTWTAPSNGWGSDSVDRYEIRYIYDKPFDWDSAFPVLDPPRPASPGDKQSYRFRYPDRGRDLYMAISSVGLSGNPSSPSNTAYIKVPGFSFTGVCRDVYTGDPLAEIKVEVQGTDGPILRETNVDGEFTLFGMAPQELEVILGNGGNAPAHFLISQTFILTKNISHTFLLIPYQRSEVLPSLSLLQLFKTATDITFKPHLLKWAHRPVRTYIPSFVNTEGVDYSETARASVQRWMDRTGIELFEFVEAPPDTGIEFHFKKREEMRGFIGVTRHTFGSDGLPLKDNIEVVDDFIEASSLYLVLLHETGHTIQFKHLPNSGFIMYGSHPLPADISDDEVRLARLLEALPNRIDMRIYQDPDP